MAKSTRNKLNLKEPIHHLITIGEFSERIKRKPDSIFEDFDVKYAIEVLQRNCLSNNSGNAKCILEKADLKAYIPRSSRGRLKKYKDYPERLYREVETYREKLEKELPKRGKTLRQVKEVIERYTGHKPKILVSKFTLRDMAMYIVAVKSGVGYGTLRNFYYPLKEKKPLLIITSTDKGHPLYRYREAYSEYIIKNHTDIPEIFDRLQKKIVEFLKNSPKLIPSP